jgi:hypothetical protein
MISTPTPVAVSDAAAVAVLTTTADQAARLVSIFNDGPSVAYLGGSDVTSTAGLPLAVGAYLEDDALTPGTTWYARCATGQTASLRILVSTRGGG